MKKRHFFLLFIACFSLHLSANNVEKTGETRISDNIQFDLSGKQYTITLKDFYRLKEEMLALLQQKEPKRFYVGLIEELNESKPVILPDNRVFIGTWDLIVRDNKIFFERQQIPRSTHMLFFEATLLYENGVWHVDSVQEITIHGR